MTKAQILGIESVARYNGVSVKPFVNWAISTNQPFSRIACEGYGSRDERRALVAEFVNSL